MWFPHPKANNNSQLTESVFTTDELIRLTALRDHVRAHPQQVVYCLDENQIDFMRWLVEHGRMGEGVKNA